MGLYGSELQICRTLHLVTACEPKFGLGGWPSCETLKKISVLRKGYSLNLVDWHYDHHISNWKVILWCWHVTFYTLIGQPTCRSFRKLNALLWFPMKQVSWQESWSRWWFWKGPKYAAVKSLKSEGRKAACLQIAVSESLQTCLSWVTAGFSLQLWGLEICNGGRY